MITFTSSDETLVGALAAGDRVALAILYHRYSPHLRRVTFYILRHEQDAEDLVHEVFLEAWRRAPSFDPTRASVRTWLALMGKCRAIDRRHRQTLAESAPSRVAWAEPRAGADPDHTVDSARVASSLQSLPTHQREVLWLAYFEGLTTSEIASQLSIPRGTVKSRLAAALSSMRLRLGVERDPQPLETPIVQCAA